MILFRAWLDSAYAMEYGTANILRRYANGAEEYPDIKGKFFVMAQHAEDKADKIKAIISGLGKIPASEQKALKKFAGMWQCDGDELAVDHVLKHMLAAYSGINLSIANYIMVASAAHEVDQEDMAELAEEFLSTAREEAEWFEKRLSSLTVEFLQQRRIE